ncbi:MAG: sigma-E factor negative regulatory protein [Gammaproteobacteria bacterium]|nr:sigma-E factor negative regulatory protein [Gammaproteobacteria bacterium]MDH5303266.1 sigma-E factor negative regulatory protein [Gammaproteobacteria bacterium]MDH5322032.1 sigma-E factor negative regulatory protein [Gammaproteobacteria bacterium]
MNEGIKMQISAFVDGELPAAEAQLLLRRLSQDFDLRQQAAEYLALGRALRGQRSIAALGDLRGRVVAAIDDKTSEEEFAAIEAHGRRYLRPLTGLAIAATVAVAAIFGLQQFTAVPGAGTAVAPAVVAEAPASESYTVPDIKYFQRHSQFSMESGFSNFETRRVSFEIHDDADLESGLQEIEPREEPGAERTVVEDQQAP